jgi:hypothetical protein
MAYGETLSQLLGYYSRLAGRPTDDPFKTLEELVAWAKEHRPGLDLSRPPQLPKGLVQ